MRAGVVSLSLGTSGVVFATTDGPAIEPEGRLHAFCHSVPGKWHFMGVMLSAAGSLRWHRDTFVPDTDFDKLLEPVSDLPYSIEHRDTSLDWEFQSGAYLYGSGGADGNLEHQQILIDISDPDTYTVYAITFLR